MMTTTMTMWCSRLLSELFPGSTPLVEAVSSTRQHWLALHEANIVSPSEILKNAID